MKTELKDAKMVYCTVELWGTTELIIIICGFVSLYYTKY